MSDLHCALALLYLLRALVRRSRNAQVAQNRKTVLLQTYRRNMGGGKFVLMKDLSSAIFVDARLLGRLNRRFARR